MTAKQERALAAMLTHRTYSEAAAAAGIGEATLYRYLRDAEFCKAYRERLDELRREATDKAKKAMPPALDVLSDIAQNEDTQDTARISAARSVLEYGLKLTEREDVLQRLDELERIIAQDER